MTMELRDKICWVVGLARSGCAAGGLLRRHGARVIGIDDAQESELSARWLREGVARESRDAFDEVASAGRWPEGPCDLVVISPGVPTAHPRLLALPDFVEVYPGHVAGST